VGKKIGAVAQFWSDHPAHLTAGAPQTPHSRVWTAMQIVLFMQPEPPLPACVHAVLIDAELNSGWVLQGSVTLL
jgi:hypothetical protein